jgi:hypothetical protein
LQFKRYFILPLASALASLTGQANAATTPADPQTPTTSTQDAAAQIKVEPNTFFTAGNDLLGLLVTQQADGTIIAQHASHASHSSHASHASHASSRY